MSPNVSVEENWEPEPELRDMPPRRIERTDEPDLNLPSLPIWLGLGGALMILAIILFVVGHGKPLFTVPGILFLLTGFGCAVLGPYNANRHKQRCEHLVTNGVPKMVRVITSDNLAGSVYKRNVRYQYIDLNGDVKHRDVNIDDRLLPKRIPANMTAVMDVNTGDTELYLALPIRAVAKTVVATPVVIPTAASTSAYNNATATPNPTPVTTATAKVATEKMATMSSESITSSEEAIDDMGDMDDLEAAMIKTTRKSTRKIAKSEEEKKSEEVYE
jgi:hypothetical protein